MFMPLLSHDGESQNPNLKKKRKLFTRWQQMLVQVTPSMFHLSGIWCKEVRRWEQIMSPKSSPD